MEHAMKVRLVDNMLRWLKGMPSGWMKVKGTTYSMSYGLSLWDR